MSLQERTIEQAFESASKNNTIKSQLLKKELVEIAREVMEERKMSKWALARRMDTSPTQVGRTLDPNYIGTSIKTLSRLAIALDLTFEVKFKLD